MRLRNNHLFVVISAVFVLILLLQVSLVPNVDEKQKSFLVPRHNEGGKTPEQKLSAQIRKSSIGGADAAHNETRHRHPDNGPYDDKEKVMEMLREMQVDPYSIDKETWAQVPSWKQVTDIWGTEPLVWGMEHCDAYRKQIAPRERRVAVAGIFSTGTNLLAQLLQHNCGIPERIEWLGRTRGHGMEWQVPWGKHNPFRYRGKHAVRDFTNDRHNAKLQDYLAVATIRDPYGWMASMCRHPYTVRWQHAQNKCPNMVQNGKIMAASAKFGADPNRVPFGSLAHLWNDWNGEYFNETKIPAIMVRFEDLVFFPREVTQKVCECAGGRVMAPHKVSTDKEASKGSFHYVVGSSLTGPGHGFSKRNGLLDAWIKYAQTREGRRAGFSKSDLEFSEQVFNQEMMKAFRYDK